MINISKEEFEAAMPAMAYPTDEVFEKVSPQFSNVYDSMSEDFLGETGVSAVEGNTQIRHALVSVISLHGVLRIFRSLDLVITPTGFGVVSNQNVAPASSARVNALEADLQRALLNAQGRLVTLLTTVEGWGAQSQAAMAIPMLFYKLSMLRTFCGITNPSAKDWDSARPQLLKADEFLRKHVGDEFLKELLVAVRTNALTNDQRAAVNAMLEVMAGFVLQDRKLTAFKYRRLMRLLEKDNSTYTTYLNSNAYALNHAQNFRNTADSAGFVFNG